jgi:predicted RNA binding protein YcfA (HicA-like mRNA interferase family)
MRRSPGSVRFSEVEALRRYEGFVLFNARGSHRTYHRADGRLLTLVRSHGGRAHCHPADIRKLLELLQP